MTIPFKSAFIRLKRNFSLIFQDKIYPVPLIVACECSFRISEFHQQNPDATSLLVIADVPEDLFQKFASLLCGGNETFEKSDVRLFQRLSTVLQLKSVRFPLSFYEQQNRTDKDGRSRKFGSVSVLTISLPAWNRSLPKSVEITTNHGIYHLTELAACVSPVLSQLSFQEPLLYAVDDPNGFFQDVISAMSGGKVHLSQRNFSFMWQVAFDLQIAVLIPPLQAAVQTMEENRRIIAIHQKVFESVAVLQQSLLNLTGETVLFVAAECLKSNWFASVSRIEEFTVHLIVIAEIRPRMAVILADFVYELRENEIFLPFFTRKVLRATQFALAPFVFALFRRGLIPIDLIVKGSFSAMMAIHIPDSLFERTAHVQDKHNINPHLLAFLFFLVFA
jgi:hypothetical protein